jgi:fluoride ion exporter CrcB/FEX
VAIAVGRALGAAFPWGTLIINIVGSFLIGVFVESFALAWSTSQMVRVFLTVGICGGFTSAASCGPLRPTSLRPWRRRSWRCTSGCNW